MILVHIEHYSDYRNVKRTLRVIRVFIDDSVFASVNQWIEIYGV